MNTQDLHKVLCCLQLSLIIDSKRSIRRLTCLQFVMYTGLLPTLNLLASTRIQMPNIHHAACTLVEITTCIFRLDSRDRIATGTD